MILSHWFDSWVRKICWRRDTLSTTVFLGFPGDSAGKESACNVGDLGLIPGLGRSPGEGNGYPLQNSGLENSMDCIVLGVAKSRTGQRDFHFQVSSDIQNGMGDASKSHLPYQPAAGEKEEREWALIKENSRRNTVLLESVLVPFY